MAIVMVMMNGNFSSFLPYVLHLKLAFFFFFFNEISNTVLFHLIYNLDDVSVDPS